jgi:hypothetical protein
MGSRERFATEDYPYYIAVEEAYLRNYYFYLTRTTAQAACQSGVALGTGVAVDSGYFVPGCLHPFGPHVFALCKHGYRLLPAR